jgi:hypothetical protein
MRRFFRFSIRDLLWLTLVVAMGAGWFSHARQLDHRVARVQAEADQLQERVTQWRGAAGALELFVRTGAKKWTVTYDFASSTVRVERELAKEEPSFIHPWSRRESYECSFVEPSTTE